MYRYKALKIKGKKIDEHRKIVGDLIGRKLDRKEIVHHKDGNPRNNSLSNLEILNLESHSRKHMFTLRPFAKLSERQALSIFLSDMPNEALAEFYNVSTKAIKDIKSQRRWGQITHRFEELENNL